MTFFTDPPLHDFPDRFLISWSLRRRPGAERQELIALAEASHEDAAVRREVEQMGQTLRQTWEEEVMSRGIERGSLLTRRDDLRAVLELRFGPLPEAVVRGIEETVDAERLRACLLQAHQMKSLDELQL